MATVVASTSAWPQCSVTRGMPQDHGMTPLQTELCALLRCAIIFIGGVGVESDLLHSVQYGSCSCVCIIVMSDVASDLVTPIDRVLSPIWREFYSLQ